MMRVQILLLLKPYNCVCSLYLGLMNLQCAKFNGFRCIYLQCAFNIYYCYSFFQSWTYSRVIRIKYYRLQRQFTRIIKPAADEKVKSKFMTFNYWKRKTQGDVSHNQGKKSNFNVLNALLLTIIKQTTKSISP